MSAILGSLLGLALWICSLLLLRLTPLTGAALFFASIGLTLALSFLGWVVLTLRGRGRPR